MAWTYPDDRYGWLDEARPSGPASDGEIKAVVVDRLRNNPQTKDDDIRVDVKQPVVILGAEVSSWAAKRAAGGDDAWDTRGVVGLSNQLVPRALSLEPPCRAVHGRHRCSTEVIPSHEGGRTL